ncbi:response regulator transcription factor [Bordetella genomosp. 9]|uniref:DNA-binding response regulator n=1 Tax=Bordetella genomosp. 9 TaxID=1416803 RepID=A0A1W6Z495_9BORD|nr:response regulator transcription factor [Bordetella genomosp. 9]ARP87964.1 DNA-binding response regulator [Bordetella genomosp. 9]
MRILLVEDNADLGDAIESKLRASGHSVEWVRDGETALRWIRLEAWDALVLDIMLPGKSGFDVIRELRASGVEAPVLVITARAEIEDKIDMLDLGADDYLVKPFDLRELEARLRALLRRPAGRTTSVAVHGNLTLDVAGRTAHIAGVPVTLGRREFRLLEILLDRIGSTVSKERLMSQLFDLEDVLPNALELLVSRLRRKIAGATVDIVTVRGVGYQARHHDDSPVSS